MKLFITNEIQESALHHTNTKIIETISKLPENFNEYWLNAFRKEISMDELIAYLGLLYLDYGSKTRFLHKYFLEKMGLQFMEPLCQGNVFCLF